jgi:TRAP-type C4-dicarboxylate transport system permease small subunit
METEPTTSFLGSPGAVVPALLAALALLLLARAWVVRAEPRARRFAAISGGLERGVLTVLLGTMIVLSALQILLRNLFATGLLWIDPLLRHLVLWIGFLGAAAATSRGAHIAIDVLSRVLPEVARSPLRRGLALGAAAVCLLLARAGYVYLQQERELEAEAFLGLSTWQVQSVLSWGFVLLAYRFLVAALFGRASEPPVVEERDEIASGPGGAVGLSDELPPASPGAEPAP